MIGPLEYNDAVEALAKEYSPRAQAILRRIADGLEAEGFTLRSGPYEMFDDTYRWSIVVQRPGTTGDDDAVDLTVEIAEAAQYDGDDAKGGVNFGLDIVEYGGRMLGGLTPFNYTDRCWVPMGDADQVEERFAILEQADVSTVPELCARS